MFLFFLIEIYLYKITIIVKQFGFVKYKLSILFTLILTFWVSWIKSLSAGPSESRERNIVVALLVS